MLTHNLHICNTNTVTRDETQTALDHIHTNNLHNKLHLHYIPNNNIDHRLIFTEIMDTTLQNTKYHSRYTTKETDYATLKNQLQNTPIQLNTNTTSDINDIYNKFIDYLTNCLERCTKTKRKTIKSNLKPWYDEELDKSIKHRNFWHKKRIQDPQNQQVNTEYKIARNLATATKRKKK